MRSQLRSSLSLRRHHYWTLQLHLLLPLSCLLLFDGERDGCIMDYIHTQIKDLSEGNRIRWRVFDTILISGTDDGDLSYTIIVQEHDNKRTNQRSEISLLLGQQPKISEPF
mmetsp:Transcript_3681/g.6094  ORF Transcript_3681/g.6094 Transcript_3681/m.6094 type:complete len:111 (-) Transcript_3681:245-577(-)